jgi:hypothetical protein
LRQSLQITMLPAADFLTFLDPSFHESLYY